MRIMMTGATAGIGLEAAKRLLGRGPCALIVAARNPHTAPPLLQRQAELRPADLASLDSVRTFAARLLGEAPIDAMVLNAGVQFVGPRKSADGYELTFAVNHLAHYLLARLLAPHLSRGGRIVITSSGTHDPHEKTGMPTPRHADAWQLAYPCRDPDADGPGQAGLRAYTSSKLCNVMTARMLARKLAAPRPDVAICAFDPGLTPGTGLARNYPWPAGPIFRLVLPLIVRGTARVSTPAVSGGLLADLVTSPEYGTARGDYFAVRGGCLTKTQPSRLAQDDVASEALWNDSAALVGLEEACPCQ
jgi:NAD(P)-dependent dehydrogenase (short-subunit alcohol dehydrogenase family)